MNAADLEAAWANTPAAEAAGTLSGKTVHPRLGLRIAVDHSGLRHLLIPATPGDQPPKRPAAKGLEVIVDELEVASEPARTYYDVACGDAAMNDNFTAVAAEIIQALEEDATQVCSTLERIFARWRWFWGSPPGGLQDEEIVGLFGELWFMEFWLDPVDLDVVETWAGPDKDRHDFKWPAASVEVKATRSRTDGSATHLISNLGQLADPETGQLYVFSLRITPDPIGHHSLTKSIERLVGKLQSRPEAAVALNERLGQLGYSPADSERYDQPFRVAAEELYRVGEGFPRLTLQSFPNGVPTGVDNIAYTLNLVACADWRVATGPEQRPVSLRSSLGS